MQRTVTLLLLFMIFVAAARSQGEDPNQSTDRATKRAKDGVSSTLKSLNSTASQQRRKQTDANARRLNEQIVERMNEVFPHNEDFSNESNWKEIAGDLTEWSKSAHDPGKPVPQGRLVNAIDQASNAYRQYQLIAGETGGIKDEAGGKSESAKTPPSLSSLEKEVIDLRTQMNSQASIVPPWLSLGVMTLAPLLTIGLGVLAFIVFRSAGQKQDAVNNMVRQSIVNVTNKQDGLAAKLESLTVAESRQAVRLAELSGEIGAVGSKVRGLRASPIPAGPTGDGGFAAVTEPPAFPASADRYLQKMQRHATVVKPDFQNGVLVADMEKKGEFVLVEDLAVSNDASLIIPRFTQFQMKQDFYTYYEGYYECERPASGIVWILVPAMVERVQDGWSLLQKGVLEVR
jgi:hypothetical protein